MKKAQVTIFIIISIIVVVGVVVFIVFRNIESNRDISLNSNEVYNFVQNCSSQSLEKIIYLLGIRGGYMFAPEYSNDFGIPYYYNKGIISVITQEQLEDEIEYYLNQEIENCIDDFANFPDFRINSGNLNSNIKMDNDKIILNLKYNVDITQKDNSIILLEDFKDIILPIKVGLMRDISEQIVYEDITDEEICLSCITNLLKSNNLKGDILEYNGEYIIIIKDESYKINEDEFVYSFAIKQ